MKIRFAVNQAEAFRRGVDVQKPTHIIEVDPATLSQEDRNLLADRLCGIDLNQMMVVGEIKQSGWHITAMLPTFEAMMEAVRENEREVQKEFEQEHKSQRSIAEKSAQREKAAA
jgi:hypothetical protein